MFNAKIQDNFLTQEEIDTLLEFAINKEKWEDGGSDFWNNRSLNAPVLMKSSSKKDNEIGKMLYRIADRMGYLLKTLYNEKEIYCDTFQIVRWFEGQEQPPHCDDMKNHDNTDEVFKPYHHRDYGAIVYLNNDYVGGKTFYPQHDQEITPEPGKLAIHPGGVDHMHGVTKISGGMRFTLASFWTRDKKYENMLAAL